MTSLLCRWHPLVGIWESIFGGPHFSEAIMVGIISSLFNCCDCRFNAADCTNEEELPDFSPLDNFTLHPELQVK